MKIIKNSIVLTTLMLINTSQASNYVVTLDDKHYQESISVTEYIAPESPSIPSNPVFNLNDVTTNDYSGNVAWNRGCQCYSLLDENLSDGWSYLEFKLSNSYKVAAGGGVAMNGSMISQLYGSNGSTFANNSTISVLVKLPEGKVWYAKDGSWLSGANPRNYLDGIDGGTPYFNFNPIEGDSVKFAFYSGTKSVTTSYNIYNNKSGREYVHLENLGLTD